MRKILCCLISAALAAVILICPAAAEEEQAQTGAKAEILIEANTGQVLYSLNPDEKLPMASITKVMALLLWAEDIENGKLALEDKVTASAYAGSTEGSVIWLTEGEEMTVAELLEAVIISSANDACIALAEHTSGSEEKFVKRMNEKATELGMTNTRYANCVGFDAEGHYSTAKDIATVTSAVMEHEVYRGWMLTWLDYLRGGDTQLVNTNRLIRSYDGILGGKTGTTDNAGCCLTVCAERGELRLIAVTLGNPDDDSRFSSAEGLLDYGFDSFQMFTPEVDMTKLQPIPVERGTEDTVRPIVEKRGGKCVIRKGRASDIVYEYTFVEGVQASVEKGQFLGEYLVTLDGAEVYRSDIVAEKDIPEMDFWRYLWYLLGEIIAM